MKKGRQSYRLWVPVVLAVALLLAACAPAAVPTPTATKPPAVPTKAPQAAPTKASEPAPTKAAVAPTQAPAKAAAPAKPTGKPVRLAYLAPFSGPLAQFGFLQRVAVKMALEDVNASGGINGAPLEIIEYDSPFNPKEAVTLTRKAAEQDKVFAILGPYASGEFEVAAPLGNDLKIPVITMTSTKPGITDANRPWSFRLNLTDDVSLPVAVDGWKKTYPNVKKVVIVGDTKEAVNESVFKNIYPKILTERGFQVLESVAFETATTDFSAIVTRIKNLNPDGIASTSLLAEGLGLAKELERQQVKAPVVASCHVIGGPFVELAGASAEGWVYCGLFDSGNPDPKVQDFVKRYFTLADADSAITPKPGHVPVQAQAYTAVMVTADIMRKASITADTPVEGARESIRKGWAGVSNAPTILGSLTMDANGNGKWPTVAFIGKAGKWVPIR